MQNNRIFIFFILLTSILLGQEQQSAQLKIVGNDTIYMYSLPDANIGKTNFEWSIEDRKRYFFLQRKVRKVYKYANEASYRYNFIHARMKEMKSAKEKERLKDITEEYISSNYTDRLKKLTRTDGKVLCKIIHYKTGKTAFDMIKELKSGWSAFWWNTKAKMFDIQIKEEFNPREHKDDFFIWLILKHDIEKGILRDPYPKFKSPSSTN